MDDGRGQLRGGRVGTREHEGGREGAMGGSDDGRQGDRATVEGRGREGC